MEAQVVRKVVMGEQRTLNALTVGQEVAVIIDRKAIASRVGDTVAQHRSIDERHEMTRPIKVKCLSNGIRNGGVWRTRIDRYVIGNQRHSSVGEHRIVQTTLIK